MRVTLLRATANARSIFTEFSVEDEWFRRIQTRHGHCWQTATQNKPNIPETHDVS